MVAAVAYGMDSIEEDTFPLELVEFVDVSSSRCKRTEDASMIIYSSKHYSFSIDQFSIGALSSVSRSSSSSSSSSSPRVVLFY